VPLHFCVWSGRVGNTQLFYCFMIWWAMPAMHPGNFDVGRVLWQLVKLLDGEGELDYLEPLFQHDEKFPFGVPRLAA